MKARRGRLRVVSGTLTAIRGCRLKSPTRPLPHRPS